MAAPLIYPEVPESALFLIGALYFGFALLKLGALAYVSVFLGPFDSRIAFSLYSVALLLAPAVIADAIAASRVSRAMGGVA